MPQYKNQHYLPQSYLRNFANSNCKKKIGIYVYDNNKYIPAGPIKTQCSESYYYGKDLKVESQLSSLEMDFKKLTDTIISNNSINESQFTDLIKMWILTAFRNPAPVEKFNKQLELIKDLSEKNPNDHSKKDINVSKSELVQINLEQVELLIPFAHDLKVILIINQNVPPFITSDNPVINYNLWAERNNRTWSANCIGSKGLISFFPISPNHTLMFFDPRIYKVKDDLTTIMLSDHNEVTSLNLLQILNCSSNIYFNQDMSKNKIDKLRESSLFYDRGPKIGARTLYNQNKDNSLNLHSCIYSTQLYFIPIKLNFSWLQLTDHATSIKIVDSDILLRDPHLTQLNNFTPEYQNIIRETINAIANSREL